MRKKQLIYVTIASAMLLCFVSFSSNRSYVIMSDNVDALCRLYEGIEGDKNWTPHYIDILADPEEAHEYGVTQIYHEEIIENKKTGERYWKCVHPYDPITRTPYDSFCFLFNFHC